MSPSELRLPAPIFEDGHVLVLDKPAGMPVQPDRSGDQSLLELVRAAYPGREVGMPHRLDRPVSGLVVFTLDAASLRNVDRQFRQRGVAKRYLAIVEGHPPAEGELAGRLQRDGRGRKSRVRPVDAGPGSSMEEGHPARLRFSRQAAGDRYALLEIVPEGGAFHQIRALLAASGHPIRGDVKYGARRAERDRTIALHAWKLHFAHPATGAPMDVEAPVPDRSLWPVLWPPA